MVKRWYNGIGQYIKKPKKAKKHFPKELTGLADVANNTIIKIEAGENQNPTLDTLEKIAKALRVKPKELLEYE